MTTKKIYDPWVKWHGGECPVPPDTFVEVKLRCEGLELSGLAKTYYWRGVGGDADIVEYRTITEQPDLDAAEKLLRDNGYTVTPPAKPLTFEDVTPMTEAPLRGTEYWVVSPFSTEGAVLLWWAEDAHDKSALRRRMAYLDKEHALVAARHLFGLKGGEL